MSDPKPFQSDELRLCIDALVRVFKVTDSPSLGPGATRLNPPDMQALLFVAQNANCISNDLGTFLQVVPTTTSSIVDRLVRQGLLYRTRSDENRRVVHLKLSEAGQKVVDQIIAQQNDQCRTMLSQLSPSERDQFLRAAKKIAAGIS